MDWISVDDRLPAPKTKVLAGRVGRTGKKTGPFICWKTGSPYSPWEYADGSRVEFCVTHWMPCPELPAS